MIRSNLIYYERRFNQLMITMKKQLFSLAFALCLILGTWGNVQAAPAAIASVGYVDVLYLINQHPDTAQANAVLKTEQDAVKLEFETKSPGLNDQEKQNLDRQLRQRLDQKRLELLKPITDKILVAANAVVAEKGLAIVISKNEVVCGGVDITADVMKKITGK